MRRQTGSGQIALLVLAVVAGVGLVACQPSPSPSAPSATLSANAWTRLQLPDLDAAALIGDVVAVDEGFVLVGGINGNPAVWWSGDGLDWTVDRVPGPPGIVPLRAFATSRGTILLGGGSSEHCAHPAAVQLWARPPGGDWAIAPFNQLFCADPYVSDVASNGTSFLLAGTGFGEVGLAWRSEDGLEWAEATPQGMRQTYPRAAAWTGTDYIVLAIAEPETVEWSSADGVTWERNDVAIPVTMSSASIARVGEQIIALVRDSNDVTTTWQRNPDGEWVPIEVPGLQEGVELRQVAGRGDQALFLATQAGRPIIVAWRPGDPTASAAGAPEDAIDLLGFAEHHGTVVLVGGVGNLEERHSAAWAAPSSVLP